MNIMTPSIPFELHNNNTYSVNMLGYIPIQVFFSINVHLINIFLIVYSNIS